MAGCCPNDAGWVVFESSIVGRLASSITAKIDMRIFRIFGVKNAFFAYFPHSGFKRKFRKKCGKNAKNAYNTQSCGAFRKQHVFSASKTGGKNAYISHLAYITLQFYAFFMRILRFYFTHCSCVFNDFYFNAH